LYEELRLARIWHLCGRLLLLELLLRPWHQQFSLWRLRRLHQLPRFGERPRLSRVADLRLRELARLSDLHCLRSQPARLHEQLRLGPAVQRRLLHERGNLRYRQRGRRLRERRQHLHRLHAELERTLLFLRRDLWLRAGGAMSGWLCLQQRHQAVHNQLLILTAVQRRLLPVGKLHER
jgi:hypothetical protein